jgi:cation diffusion facilitator family transporter
MHVHSIEPWRHQHAFLGEEHQRNERRTWLVVVLTAVTMVVEIAGGTAFGSMALVADGWHMATHAGALAIAGFAYWFARKHVHDARFTFGTGKLGELAGFASAVLLALIALLIGYESVIRIYAPVAIQFNEAIAIAITGLAVNIASAFLLREHHDHHHEHHDEEAHQHGHHDSNLRAAYVHVLTDALTSVLAIVGLLAARVFGLNWIDPVVGLLGAAVILVWSFGLIRSAAMTLLDIVPDGTLALRIRNKLEVGGDRVSDLHLWRVGPGHSAVLASIVTEQPQDPAAYKARLAGFKGLSHISVEVHTCPEHDHAPGAHQAAE